MKRLFLLVPLALVAACASEQAADDPPTSDDELRQKNVACRSQRLTNEGYRGEGAFVGNDGAVYVNARVCIQDDDDCSWVQCDKEEGGGDWNGGPRGDWYGFWDTGEPMRGPCTTRIAKSGCGGGGHGFCQTQAHGKVAAYTCFQEADWKWYQCQKDGVVLGAFGPNSGPLGACAGALWYRP